MTTVAINPDDAKTPAEARHRIFSIVGAATGNLVEWYDFYVYAFTAIYFSAEFFPSGDTTSQLLNTSAIFFAGFLLRPVGSWIFGRIADRYGRRTSMVISVLAMCFGSLIIAVLPTYASIGLLAPILLFLVRVLQGISVGGEYGTSATYMSEVAIGGRRGFYGSFQYVTLIGGQLLATLVLTVLQLFLTQPEMKSWGWRIPFAIGAVVAVVAYYLRRGLTETSTEKTRSQSSSGTLSGIFKEGWTKNFLIVVGFTAGGSLIFYTYTTYMGKFLVTTAGFSKEAATNTMTIVLFVYMCMQPIFGALADRIGRKMSMILFTGLSTLTTVPLMSAIGATKSPVMAFVLITIALAIVSLYTSISGLVKAELFPPQIRALAVGLAYAIGNALFGGSAEYVALWLKSIGIESTFFWYVTVMMAIGFVISLIMPNHRTEGYLQGDGMEH
jgi:MHS family alpha-ketoglutarate permease-like MFS transporter